MTEPLGRDAADLLLDSQLLGPKVGEPGFGIVGGADDQVGQRVDHQPQPRLRADEAEVLGQGAVEKGEDILGVRCELVGRLVPSGLEEAVQPARVAGAPAGEVRLGPVAQGVRVGFLNDLAVGDEGGVKFDERNGDAAGPFELLVEKIDDERRIGRTQQPQCG